MKRLSLLALTGVLAALLVVPAAAPAAQKAKPPQQLYVSLGDSYATGYQPTAPGAGARRRLRRLQDDREERHRAGQAPARGRRAERADRRHDVPGRDPRPVDVGQEVRPGPGEALHVRLQQPDQPGAEEVLHVGAQG